MDPVRVFCEFAHGIDASTWPARHAMGEVPNRLPFGVDDLEALGCHLAFGSPLQGRLTSRLAAMASNRLGQIEWVEGLASAGRHDRRKADVILCWDEWNGVPAGLVRRVSGGPPVVTGLMNLTDWLFSVRGLSTVFRRSLQAVAAGFVHAPAMIPAIRDDWGMSDKKIHYVPVGIDVSYFCPSPFPAVPDLVVSVGDDRHRDHETLVRAMTILQQERRTARLELATNLPIDVPANVGLLHRRKLGPLRQSFYGRGAVVAIAAHPNVHGSGLSVLLEGMASGRPYVITEGKGLANYVRSGETGFVVPHGDPHAMAAALGRLLADPVMADEMGAAGRMHVEREFSSTAQAAHLLPLLEHAVAH